jgi:hypothetical protein
VRTSSKEDSSPFPVFEQAVRGPRTWHDPNAETPRLKLWKRLRHHLKWRFSSFRQKLWNRGATEETRAHMTSTSETLNNMDIRGWQRVSRGEALLLCCSLLSLIGSCVLWFPHKQAWMDELFTWKEVSDPSLWHCNPP